MHEGIGVCRDFAHLAIALCRCMNIPARYCTGYLGDIGVPPDINPGDFSAWGEVFLDGRWYTMDARHNHPRMGRIVMGRGRDAADVAMSTAFGVAHVLGGWCVGAAWAIARWAIAAWLYSARRRSCFRRNACPSPRAPQVSPRTCEGASAGLRRVRS